jgi:DNA-binding Xre family transcriptional regulator
MKPNLNIHFWDISGYINISFETKELIFNLIKRKISLNKFSEKLKISDVSLNHFLKNRDSFIRISNLLEIIKNLNFSKFKIEKEIIGYKDTSSKDFFQIKFPYFLSPIHFRIGGVLIGDGNVHKTNKLLRWIQKDTTPLKELIEFTLNKKIYPDSKSFQIVIPSFFGKILCASLKLDFDSLANEIFLDKILILSKNYRLVLLISIIEDEGNIDVNNYGGINIRMSSKKIIFAIKQLCDSLNYKTSEIVCYKNEGNFGNNIMYKVKINAEGIRKMGPDLLSLEKKFGNQISLWKKRKSFFDRWNKSIGEKAMKDLEGKKIHEQIMELFKNNFQLRPLQISNNLDLDYDRVYELIKNMFRRGEIKRVRKGVYCRFR